MHRTGLVFLEDTETFRKILKSTRFWKIDISLISKKLIIHVIKSLYNLLIRIENYNLVLYKIYEKKENSNIFKKKKNEVMEKISILKNALMRTDEILSILYV